MSQYIISYFVIICKPYKETKNRFIYIENFLDVYKRQEYNGFLRIATTVNMRNNSWNGVFGDSQDYNNYLYVLDMELREAGKIKDFGLDETIKSVNFQGDTAYIVTFRQDVYKRQLFLLSQDLFLVSESDIV